MMKEMAVDTMCDERLIVLGRGEGLAELDRLFAAAQG